MTHDEIPDDHWQSRNIAELAWFLSTGSPKGPPNLCQPNAVASVQAAYLLYFTETLAHLIELSGFPRRASDQRDWRLLDFNRKSILQALKDSSWLDRVHTAARRWLANEKQPKRYEPRERASKAWIAAARAEFEASNPLESTEAWHERNQRFLNTVLKPENKRLRKIGLRHSTKSALNHLANRNAELAELARQEANNGQGFDFPELKVERKRQFYAEERLKINPGDDPAENLRRFKNYAGDLIVKITNDVKDNHGRHFDRLLGPDGTIPTVEEICRELNQAVSLTAGKS
jgi:hypothetical protein